MDVRGKESWCELLDLLPPDFPKLMTTGFLWRVLEGEIN